MRYLQFTGDRATPNPNHIRDATHGRSIPFSDEPVTAGDVRSLG
jgi:hypothetical protein